MEEKINTGERLKELREGKDYLWL